MSASAMADGAQNTSLALEWFMRATLDSMTSQVQLAKYDAHYTLLTNYVAFMGYTILVWDHILTFSDETYYIWAKVARPNPSQRPLIYLFLFNRYFTPLVFIGNLVAYLGRWSLEHCKHFVRYEGACTAIALAVAELILWLRVRALYWNLRVVPCGLLVIWLLQQMISAWLLTNGQPVLHMEPFDRACTMIFSSNVGNFPPSLSAWLPLLYDTLVIGLVLYRCVPHRNVSTSHIIDALIRDGIIYYSVLFSINLLLGIMIIAAPDATKNITAQLEQLFTVAMISRITLSLQREGRRSMEGSVSLLENSFDVKKYEIQHIEDIELAELYPAQRRHRVAGTTERNEYYRPADFAARPITTDRSIGSETRRNHISVVAISPPNQSLGTVRHGEQLSRVDSDTTRVPPEYGGARRAQEEDVNEASITTSFGVISISPQHTEEAVQAASRWAQELRVMRSTPL